MLLHPAMASLTCGAAMLVPLTTLLAVSEEAQALVM